MFRKLVFTLFVAVLLAFALPALAQTEAPLAEPEANPLTPLLAMAASVFAVMELIKNFALGALTDTLEYRAKAAINWGVASLLAFLLMLGAAPGLDIFTLTGYPSPFPDIVARFITALAIGAGNGVLHAVYEFLRTPRTAVIATESRAPARPQSHW